MYCASIFPLVASATILFALSTAMLTRNAAADDAGAIIGLDMALASLQRVIAPLIGTWVSLNYGYAAISMTCFIFVNVGIATQVYTRGSLTTYSL